jgi:hypothetical protein
MKRKSKVKVTRRSSRWQKWGGKVRHGMRSLWRVSVFVLAIIGLVTVVGMLVK